MATIELKLDWRGSGLEMFGHVGDEPVATISKRDSGWFGRSAQGEPERKGAAALAEKACADRFTALLSSDAGDAFGWEVDGRIAYGHTKDGHVVASITMLEDGDWYDGAKRGTFNEVKASTERRVIDLAKRTLAAFA